MKLAGKLDKPMIQKWETTFDRIFHQHPVPLAIQQIARHKRFTLNILCTIEGMVGANLIRQRIQHGLHSPALKV